MAVGGMLIERHIIHAANRAGAGFVTTAAFAVHRAYISRGILRSLIGGMLRLAGRGLLLVSLFVLVATAARSQGKGAERQANHSCYKDVFHNY